MSNTELFTPNRLCEIADAIDKSVKMKKWGDRDKCSLCLCFMDNCRYCREILGCLCHRFGEDLGVSCFHNGGNRGRETVMAACPYWFRKGTKAERSLFRRRANKKLRRISADLRKRAGAK